VSSNFELNLENAVVLVTGATGGIGRSVATAFASSGARVCLVDREQEALNGLAATLPSPRSHVPIAADLTDLRQQAAVLDRCDDELGGVYALVHLAAVLRRRFSVDDVTEEDWDFQLDTNLKASFFLNRSVAQRCQKRQAAGRLINFTSQGWWTGGYGGSVVYSASKGGLVSMTRGLARYYAKDKITVNTISPGAADTSMARGGQSDEQMQAFVDMIPMGRMAHPDELAGAALFLASDLASYVTGATVNVSGGQLMY
jgi:NAD(P)-dependent dehydrogenase (short-subunit alcohol dehydrogenase family)